VVKNVRFCCTALAWAHAFSIALSFIAHKRTLHDQDVSITGFAEGVSALGASDFNTGIDFNELAEN